MAITSAKYLPQDITLAEACERVGLTAADWPELHAKARAAGMILIPGPRSHVVDLCQEGLCMETAAYEVRVSSGGRSAAPRLCSAHKDVMVSRATEAGGIEVQVVTVGPRMS